jgi:hypothetical protein
MDINYWRIGSSMHLGSLRWDRHVFVYMVRMDVVEKVGVDV